MDYDPASMLEALSKTVERQDAMIQRLQAQVDELRARPEKTDAQDDELARRRAHAQKTALEVDGKVLGTLRPGG